MDHSHVNLNPLLRRCHQANDGLRDSNEFYSGARSCVNQFWRVERISASASTPGSGNSRCTGVGVIYSNECSVCVRDAAARYETLPVGSGRLMRARQAAVEYTIGYDLPVHALCRVCTQPPRKPPIRSWFTARRNTWFWQFAILELMRLPYFRTIPLSVMRQLNLLFLFLTLSRSSPTIHLCRWHRKNDFSNVRLNSLF